MPKFIPPSPEEANAYAKSIGYKTFDYDVWYAYYETLGWRPKGSNRQIVSWKGTVRTWFYKTPEYRELKRKEAETEAHRNQLRKEHSWLEAASEIKLLEMRKAPAWEFIWWLIDELRPEIKPKKKRKRK